MRSLRNSEVRVHMALIWHGAGYGEAKSRYYAHSSLDRTEMEKTMREDMFKVIVERPRLVNSNGYNRDGRKFRNNEDAPHILGMKRGYGHRKWLNENLAPLKRYLAKQVNRPWNKVYSEIRETIDARSTVKQHILQHIDNFVERGTHWVDTPDGGQIVVRGRGWPRNEILLEESRVELYVHPRTGILSRNRRFVTYNARNRKVQQAKQSEQLKVRRELDEFTQLHCIDGIWYEVVLAELPLARHVVREVAGKWAKRSVYEQVWDVLRREWISRELLDNPSPKHPLNKPCLYGDPHKYAVSKRQLNSQELKKHGLSR
jgi:hypothetical protein